MLFFALIAAALAGVIVNCDDRDDDLNMCSQEHASEVLDELIEGFVCGVHEFDLTEVDDDVLKIMNMVGDPLATDPNFKEIVCFHAGEVAGSKVCDDFDWKAYVETVHDYLDCYGFDDGEKDDLMHELKKITGRGKKRNRRRRRRR